MGSQVCEAGDLLDSPRRDGVAPDERILYRNDYNLLSIRHVRHQRPAAANLPRPRDGCDLVLWQVRSIGLIIIRQRQNTADTPEHAPRLERAFPGAHVGHEVRVLAVHEHAAVGQVDGQHGAEVMPQPAGGPAHGDGLVEGGPERGGHAAAHAEIGFLVVIEFQVHGPPGVGKEAVVDARVGLADGHELAAKVVVLPTLAGAVGLARASVGAATGGDGGRVSGARAGEDVVGGRKLGEQDVHRVVGDDGQLGIAGEVERVVAEGPRLERDGAEAGYLGGISKGSDEKLKIS